MEHTTRVDELLERLRQANISDDAGVGAALWLILCASDSRRFSPSEQDAVALVRSGDATRTIAVGEAVDGWTLESLAIDAAYFARGGQRARVPLPAGE